MKIFKNKTFLTFMKFCLIFVLINSLLNFFLIPADGPSRTMWNDYEKIPKNTIDIAFVGSSFSQRSLNPYIFDAKLNCNSFNFGTPGQSLSQTYATLKELFSTHHPNVVILSIDIMTTFGQKASPKAETAFIFHHKSSFREKMIFYYNILKEDDRYKTTFSVNMLFPWSYYYDFNVGFNARTKITSIPSIHTNAIIKNRLMQYGGKGYGFLSGTINYKNVNVASLSNVSATKFNQAAFDLTNKIIDLIKNNDCDLIVVNTPHPVFETLKFGDTYFEYNDKISHFFSERNISYYNYNLVKPTFYVNEADDFHDFEHLNKKGSDRFSKSICELLTLHSNGTNIDDYFFTKDGYLNSIDTTNYGLPK